MAMGLVQPRSEVTTTPRNNEGYSPRHSTRRKRLTSTSNQQNCKSVDVKIELDIVLDTPVLVLPRSSCSSQVFVAHLGKISVTNISSDKNDDEPKLSQPEQHRIFTIDEENFINERFAEDFELDDPIKEEIETSTICADDGETESETYVMDVRNMNLFSLDTMTRKGFRMSALPRAEEFYSCQQDAVPVLHDTAIQLEIIRVVGDTMVYSDAYDTKDTLQITGSVVKPLNLSLSRMQYEQLIETIENVFKVPGDLVRPPSEVPQHTQPDLNEFIEPTISSFEIKDEKVRRRLFEGHSFNEHKSYVEPKVLFELPSFVIQLKNEVNNPLIEISFRDLKVNYERSNMYETNVQVRVSTPRKGFNFSHFSLCPIGVTTFTTYGRPSATTRFEASFDGHFIITRNSKFATRNIFLIAIMSQSNWPAHARRMYDWLPARKPRKHSQFKFRPSTR